ncbi:MAG: MFS transporter [Dehalococcoidia bacterium]
MSSRLLPGARALAPLRVREFRLLFIGLVAGQAMMPLQFIAQIFWMQAETPAELRVVLVGALAAVRGAGALTFGLLGGALADRFDRRAVLLATQVAALGVNALVVLVMVVAEGDVAGVTALLALTFGASGLMAVGVPTRQAIVPELLGPELTPGGISLSNAGMQISMPVAMFASGFAIAALGFAGAYAGGSLGNLVQIAALLRMRYRSTHAADAAQRGHGPMRALADMRDGLRFTRSQHTVLWVIVLALLVTGLGSPAVANLGPTWITTEVGVDVQHFGFVAMTWGLGAFLASALLAHHAATLHRWGAIATVSALGFSLSFLVFSIATIPTAVLGNLGLGAGLAAVNIAAATIVQDLVPNRMRGRVMSVLALNLGLAQLLTLPLAAAGQIVSLRVLFPALALIQLALVAVLVIARPAVRRARIDGAAGAAPPVPMPSALVTDRPATEAGPRV